MVIFGHLFKLYGPVFNSWIKFFAVISPLHSTEPIWMEKLLLEGKQFHYFSLIFEYFYVFFGHFWVLDNPLLHPLAISRPRLLPWLATMRTRKKKWVDLPKLSFFKNFEVFRVIFGHFWSFFQPLQRGLRVPNYGAQGLPLTIPQLQFYSQPNWRP